MGKLDTKLPMDLKVQMRIIELVKHSNIVILNDIMDRYHIKISEIKDKN